ncbi:SatD family protein [Tetragenococcus halophilus]|uniref:SatD family protein n=1 Tax=Tetragenococcus halophilus TaxID=51669 RepID=UPI001F2894B6|nr:SatD family protein [Tetragenococcus halophilus]MCF1685821.1 SatD family protein [Tetragenococcus halophilus]
MTNPRTHYPYIAVIGDIKDSKKLEDRKTSQIQFAEVLEGLNQTYQKDLAAKFTISMGDSFQVLLKSGDSLMDMLFSLELDLMPMEIRIGIGLGSVDTEVDPENSLVIDGSCYHRARAMIESIEKSEKQYAQSKSNILLSTGNEIPCQEQVINTIFALETALKTGWTQRQKQIIHAYLANGRNQYATAKALDIGQSSVNKALNSTNFYTFDHSLTTLQDLIDQL